MFQLRSWLRDRAASFVEFETRISFREAMMPRFKMLLAIASAMAVLFVALPRAEAYASTASPVSAVAVHQSPASPEAVRDGARMDDRTGPVLWPTSHKTRQFAVTETPGVETNNRFRPESGARTFRTLRIIS
jgi:hypothetical protein